MPSYTVTLTEVEDKALRVVALDPQDWIDNAVHERCRIAIDAISQSEVQRKFAAGDPITGTKEDMVLASSVKTLAQIVEEQEAQENP
jgi:alkyl hydroperoxide reductase subunit AhpF